MEQSVELSQCFDELDKLRSNYLQLKENRNPILLKTATEMARQQLSCLESINDFFAKFLADSSLKENLESYENSIPMPDRTSVANFIDATNSALKVHKELVCGGFSELVLDRKVIEKQKGKPNDFSHCETNNHEFVRSIRNMVNYFSAGPPLTPENEELGDSTVNTIVSEDVLASSPI